MNLNLRKIPFGKQAKLPVAYKDIQIGDYTADFAADEKIIVEIKVISQFNSAHEAQAMHYLAATGCRLAILLNFGGTRLEQRRIVR